MQSLFVKVSSFSRIAYVKNKKKCDCKLNIIFCIRHTCIEYVVRNNSTRNMLDTVSDFPPQTEAARGNAPSATIQLPRGGRSHSEHKGEEEGKGAHTRTIVRLSRSLFRLTCSRARRAQRVPAAENSRRNHHRTHASVAIKKWKNALRIPVRILGVTHARARTRARARAPFVWHGRDGAHKHTHTTPHVVSYRHDTRIHAHT